MPNKIFTQNEFSKDFNSKIFESNLSHSSNGVITVINASAAVTIHEQRTEKNLDHVYFVHPLTDISVDISTYSRPMYRSTYRSSIGRYVDRHIGRESLDMSTEMCRSTYRLTYRSSIGRHVDRHSTDMLADMSTESDCRIVGRHVDR